MAPCSSTCGLPLCLSGITNPPSFSKEVSDHDRRRKGLKKLNRQNGGECFWPLDQATGAEIIRQDHEVLVTGGSDDYKSEEQGEGEEEVAGDLADVIRDLSSLSLTSSCTAAKAA